MTKINSEVTASSSAGLHLPADRPASLTLSERWGIHVSIGGRNPVDDAPVANAADTILSLQFRFGDDLAAILHLSWPGPMAVSWRETRGGAGPEILVQASPRGGGNRWACRFLPAVDEPAIAVIQHGRGCGQVQWWFPGEKLYTHRQLDILPVAMDGAAFRFGAFTQHGQLFDLKDWFVVEQRGRHVGVMALRPMATRPKWSHHYYSVQGRAGGVQLSNPANTPLPSGSLLLTCAHDPAMVRPVRLNLEYFEPDRGHAGWPASRIARYGFARPERLAAYQRQAAAVADKPLNGEAFGSVTAVAQALKACRMNPELAGENPLWKGEYAAAARWALDELERIQQGLTTEAYLHPVGNPVASRGMAPATATLAILESLGQLAPDRRRRAVERISTLAELMMRRDFYPSHVAMTPLGQPNSVEAIYRGMLNQNFNTDRYAFVGIAGCVLPHHPRARAWRRHAMEQFDQQMRAFVYPGGAWEESHTYANHVKVVLWPLVLALRQAPEKIDLAEDSRFRAMCRFFIPLLSPPDPTRDNCRLIPAVGDHGYQHRGGYGYLWGHLAALLPADRAEFLWAWQQSGRALTDTHTAQASVYSPLVLAPVLEAHEERPPPLPELRTLPGYGAVARYRFGEEAESLLVVRCGESWGHYHPDESSFWWYCRRRLICADADLGSGPLKFEHQGHNVLGFPGFRPVQHLDRTDYKVTRCEKTAAGHFVIECQVPFPRHQAEDGKIIELAPEAAPLVKRKIFWEPPDRLRIVDEWVRAPHGQVQWNLHLPADDARIINERGVEFDYKGHGQVHVHWPSKPLALQLTRGAATWQLCCVYAASPAQPLEHRIEFLPL